MSILTLGHYKSGSSGLPATASNYRLYYNASTKTFNKIDANGFNTTVDPVFYKQILSYPDGDIVVDHSAGDIQYLYLTSSKNVSLKNPVLDRTVILDVEMGANVSIYLPTGSGQDAILTNDSRPLLSSSGSRNIVSFHCIDDGLANPKYLTSVGTTFISSSVAVLEAPATIDNIVAWFDADNQYVDTTGTKVNSWTNRANNSANVSNTGSFRPDHVTGSINGKSAVNFSNGLLKSENSDITTAFTSSIIEITAFMVYKPTGPAGSAEFPLILNASDGGGNHTIRRDGTTLIYQISNASGRKQANNYFFQNEASMLTVQMINDNVNSFYARKDGKFTNDNGTTGQANINVDRCALGASLSDINNFAADVLELILYNRYLTVEEINTVEDYLFDKYFNPYNFDSLTAYYQFNSGSTVENS